MECPTPLEYCDVPRWPSSVGPLCCVGMLSLSVHDLLHAGAAPVHAVYDCICGWLETS